MPVCSELSKSPNSYLEVGMQNGCTNMRLLVCGGRDFENRRGLWQILDGIAFRNNVKLGIHGDCPTGADRFFKEWLKRNFIEEAAFPADWSIGKRAGPVRNQRMIEEASPTHCLAMPGGAGTADMVRRAKAASVKMWLF